MEYQRLFQSFYFGNFANTLINIALIHHIMWKNNTFQFQNYSIIQLIKVILLKVFKIN